MAPTRDIDELEELIKDHRTKKGAANDALRLAGEIRVGKVPAARGELKDLKLELREISEKHQLKIERLRKQIQNLQRDGDDLAVQWAKRMLGTTENPSGSNWGHPVQDWILAMGYTSPVPWCGVFAGYAAVFIGGADVPVPVRIGYSGYIIEDARANRNGLRAVPVAEAQPGDIFAYGTVHVGLCVGKTVNGQVHAVEGNTSPGVEGSQYNGGCVAEKFRPQSMVTVCARPAY